MYEPYWRLTRKPFDSGVDPASYYPDEVHQAALLKLRYALESHCGGALLAGPAGSGKTLLVRLLAERLNETFRPLVHLVYPAMPTVELLAYIADEFAPAQRPSSTNLDESVRRIQRALTDNAAQGRRAVLVIDEAHLVDSPRTFEALRLLLNFEVKGQSALTLLLVGQPAVLPMIDRLPQLDERLGVKCLLRPLSIEETMGYVQHRLAWAGAERTIFSAEALEAVHRQSQGLPRRINRLCDLALLVGFAEERQAIDETQIDALAGELMTVAPEE
jgi:general secretion pathway protein A